MSRESASNLAASQVPTISRITVREIMADLLVFGGEGEGVDCNPQKILVDLCYGRINRRTTS